MPNSLSLLAQCALHLRNACVRKTGLISVVASSADGLWLLHPPLTTTLHLGDVNLDDILAGCYTIEIDEGKVLDTWSDVCDSYTKGFRYYRSVSHRFRKVLPGVPFSRTHTNGSTAPLAQFLVACSRQHGKLQIEPSSVVLRVGRWRLALEDGALEWPGRRYRFEARVASSPRDSAYGALGALHQSGPKLGALMLYLLRTLPEVRDEVRLLCMVAAHLGPVGVSTLVGNFDVAFMPSAPPPYPALFFQATDIVERSLRCPVERLIKVFSPLYGRTALLKLFGEPLPSRGTLYTARRRRQHQDALLHLQSIEIGSAKGAPDAALSSLMQLEQQIGRTA